MDSERDGLCEFKFDDILDLDSGGRLVGSRGSCLFRVSIKNWSAICHSVP